MKPVNITILTVTDLHQSRVLYQQLGRAMERHRPQFVAVVGDFLDLAGLESSQQLSVKECAQALAALPCDEVILVNGNHESYGWNVFEATWNSSGRPLRLLNGASFQTGPLVVVGFPCEEDLGSRLSETEDGGESFPWLAKLMRSHGPAARTLWLMHEPPWGLALSRGNGPVGGSERWTEAVNCFRPRLVICGHDHDTPLRTKRWRDRLNDSLVINVGQKLDGPLHYAIVELTFPKENPSLPAAITVRAFPFGQASEV